jgi:hypothetical protein
MPIGLAMKKKDPDDYTFGPIVSQSWQSLRDNNRQQSRNDCNRTEDRLGPLPTACGTVMDHARRQCDLRPILVTGSRAGQS